MLFSDTGDGEAASGPGKPSLVLDEIERLPRGKCTTRTEDVCILENCTRSYTLSSLILIYKYTCIRNIT